MAPIIGLKDRETLLKSLRFGNDVKGGGDSGQPFIKKDFADEGGLGSDLINGLTQQTYGDFPIRGNTAAIIKTAEDAIRIGKFTTSFPQGLLFVTKQDGLQRSNPLIETAEQSGLRNTQQYSVGNMLRQVAVQGSGVDFPQAGIGVKQLQDPKNKYAYIVSHKEKNENRLLNLRFLKSPYQNESDLSLFSTPQAETERNNLGLSIDNSNALMFDYEGGPGSVYGLGNTLISYATDDKGNPINTFNAPKYIGPYVTEDGTQSRPISTDSSFFRRFDVLSDNKGKATFINVPELIGEINIDNTLGETNANIDTNNAPLFIGPYQGTNGKQITPDPYRSSPFYIGWNKEIVDIKEAIDKAKETIDYTNKSYYKEEITITNTSVLGKNNITPFIIGNKVDEEQTRTGDIFYDGKIDVPRREGFNRTFFSNAMTYGKLLEQPQQKPASLNGKPLPIYAKGERYAIDLDGRGNTIGDYYAREKRIGAGAVGKSDDINMLSIYSNEENPFNSPETQYGNKARDLIKFGFEHMCNNCPKTTKVHFRAFITSFSDNHNAEWQGTKYAGRGENFYTYQGFDRSVQLGFLVAAQSKEEMKPLWQKLNFLVSGLYPDYTENGYMRGNLTRFTLGEYFYRTPGIITNLNITIEQDYAWEIKMRQREGVEEDMQMELPQICSVSMTFIPILDKLPKRGTKVPLIMTDKMKGIQNYLNDKNLVNECIADSPPPPPKPSPSPTPTVVVNTTRSSYIEPRPTVARDKTDVSGYTQGRIPKFNTFPNLSDKLDFNLNNLDIQREFENDPEIQNLLKDFENNNSVENKDNYNKAVQSKNELTALGPTPVRNQEILQLDNGQYQVTTTIELGDTGTFGTGTFTSPNLGIAKSAALFKAQQQAQQIIADGN